MKLNKKIPPPPKALREAAFAAEVKRLAKSEKVKEEKTPKVGIGKSVDAIAEDYENLNREVKEKTLKLDDMKTHIKTDAAKNGIRSGSKVVIQGVDYEIGFTEIPPPLQFDEAIAKKTLKPPQFEKVFPEVTVRKFDSKALEKLLLSGAISAKEVEKFTVHGKPIRKILVRRLK